MTEFSRTPISKNPTQQKPKRSLFRKLIRMLPKSKKDFEARKISSIFALAVVIFAAFFIYKVTSTAIFYVSNFRFTDLVMLVAGKVEQDDLGRTNVLLLGVGGGQHDAPDLTDSIIVASYNHRTRIASLLSIPRDLYVNMPGYDGSRVNKIYENLKPRLGSKKALEVVRDAASKIANLDIHYYVKIDFSGFRDVIDTLGGIDIEVPKTIHDEAYPDEKMQGYTLFHVDAGLQHMDGETALKYARSRHSTSDFDRSLRQQEIIKAIKAKATEAKLFSSPMKLKTLWDTFQENIETDLSLREMITFAGIAKDFDTSRMVTKGLRDIEIVQEGGFLYTPERELYGGAFVLLPWGDTYESIHRYAKFLFERPEIYLEKARIEIQNGTGQSGVAGKLANRLSLYGFNVVLTGNTPNKEKFDTSQIYAYEPDKFTANLTALQEFLPIGSIRKAPEGSVGTESDIVIVIGANSGL